MIVVMWFAEVSYEIRRFSQKLNRDMERLIILLVFGVGFGLTALFSHLFHKRFLFVIDGVSTWKMHLTNNRITQKF